VFPFADIQRLAMRLYRDAALLLAALAPANWFLARTLVPPDQTRSTNIRCPRPDVCFIAVRGARWRWSARCARSRPTTLGHCPAADAGRRLAGAVAAGRRPGGLDAAPVLRRAQHPGARDALLLGSSPDYRGSTNFYEAVRDVITRRHWRPITSGTAAAATRRVGGIEADPDVLTVPLRTASQAAAAQLDARHAWLSS
jgi:hypothetical protein